MPGYDVIVVGARVAGAATAMLLARQGVRVLVMDQARFPSDTVSSHQVQIPGIAALSRWGLLDRLRAAGTPPASAVRFDTGDVVLHGHFPAIGAADALYSPRRTVLDALLIDAAREAGAEVREKCRADELVWSQGRVTGVRATQRGSAPVTEAARLVIGADGKHSMVAQAVAAAPYRQRPVLAFACYSYWSGLPVTGGELYQRPRRAAAVFPTNDELVMVYLAAPLGEFGAFRTDIEANYLAALDGFGDLGERARGAVRAERIRTTPDQPNTFRAAHGPGWALVGDAGVVMDSISAQGITNALRDADLLAAAIVAGLGGQRPLEAALDDRQRQRDQAIRPMYDFTTELARLEEPSVAQRSLLASLAGRPAEIDRFIGAFAGVLPVNEYFAPASLLRALGPRGVGAVVSGTARRAVPSLRKGPRTPPGPSPA